MGREILRTESITQRFGGLTAVSDVSVRLEEGEITKSTRIIIIRLENGELIGMLVDQVKEVVTLESSQIDQASYDSTAKGEMANFLSGVGKNGEELISLLDLNLVFAEKDKDK